MAYIGRGLDNGVRNQFIFAATQGQTAFTGADSDGKTLAMTDILYTDCYQNGVKLKPTTDYTVSSTTLTLISAASLNDVVDIVAFDIFGVPDTVPASTGGTFNGGISATTGTFSGNVGIKTTSPQSYYAKDLVLNALDEGGITIAGNGANQHQYLMFADGTSGAERFRGYIGYDHNIDMMQIVSGASTKFLVNDTTERMRVTNDGLTFNGDTAAANALDDYEEGSFTPSLGGNTAYNSQVGKYTKIGNMVTVWVNVYVQTIGTGSSTVISGLPFPASNIVEFNVNGNQVSYFSTLNSTCTFVAAIPAKNGSTISFQTLGANGGVATASNISILKSGTDIYFNITYRTG